MYAQFHKHNQCAEWRHWYSEKKKKKKISLLFLSYGKAVNGPYHTKMPPPPQQPTSTQSLIPRSSKQYAAVCWENITNGRKRNHQQAGCTCQSSGNPGGPAVEPMWMHHWSHCLIVYLFSLFGAAVTINTAGLCHVWLQWFSKSRSL